MKLQLISKPILAIILIVFVAIAIAFFIINDKKPAVAPTAISVPTQMTACTKNTDCTLVGFCKTFKGINYKYQQQWYKSNTQVYGACNSSNTQSIQYIPTCVNHVCTAVQVK